METINDDTLAKLGFRRPFGRWLAPGKVSIWLNQNPVDKSWSICEGTKIHISGIVLVSDLIENYRQITGDDLKDHI